VASKSVASILEGSSLVDELGDALVAVFEHLALFFDSFGFELAILKVHLQALLTHNTRLLLQLGILLSLGLAHTLLLR